MSSRAVKFAWVVLSDHPSPTVSLGVCRTSPNVGDLGADSLDTLAEPLGSTAEADDCRVLAVYLDLRNIRGGDTLRGGDELVEGGVAVLVGRRGDNRRPLDLVLRRRAWVERVRFQQSR